MASIAQDRSRPLASLHQAAVLFPPAEPADMQRMGAAWTLMCPVRNVPRPPPNRPTRALRAAVADAAGHGWPLRQEPSISLAAMPDRRTRGPSAHQIGPSPSQTAVGVQVKSVPGDDFQEKHHRPNLSLNLRRDT